MPWAKNTGKRTRKRYHDTCWCVVLFSSILHLVSDVLPVHLQDNSQMYEQWLALKREEDRKIRCSLTHKLGTVPLLHVVCYLLILAFYFNFQWVFFSSQNPRS